MDKSSQFPPYKTINRVISTIIVGSNVFGALLSYVYLALIAPPPTSGMFLAMGNVVAIIPTVLGTLLLIFIGAFFGRRSERYFPLWYERLRTGMTDKEVPENVLREVLNYPFVTLWISLSMWFIAGLTFGYFLSGSLRAFGGIFLVGGVLTSATSFFMIELLWRRVTPLFFPVGGASTVRAARLSVLPRLLSTFFLVSIYPLAMIVLLSLDRARQLIGADAPQAILNNLYIAETFVFVIGVAASVALAWLVTRSIVRPLTDLQAGMEKVEQNDLTVTVPVVSNDEFGYVTERFNHMVSGLRRGELLRNLLNLYVSPEVAREALERGAGLGGQVVECTVLFSDIRGFTTLSEKLPPDQLMDLLNRYMSRMVGVIVANGGMVNKFGGDSLLAVFGTPLNPLAEHAASAIRTALDMQASLSEFNAEQEKNNGPVLHIGIGVATGPVVAGNIGGEGRIEYTVIGDTVNLASRLQDLTKELGREILATGTAVQAATRSMSLAAEPLSPDNVRGRSGAVKIFAIISKL